MSFACSSEVSLELLLPLEKFVSWGFVFKFIQDSEQK